MNSKTDHAEISVKGVKCFAHHGVFPSEKKNGQYFFIDLDLVLDNTQFFPDDSLNNTANYADIIKTAKTEFERTGFDLIETAAHHTAKTILNNFKVIKTATVTVHKPNAPIENAEFKDISVTIKLSKEAR